MAEPNKETIYIDVDDEITTIVEKVRAADQKILALVLPKRSTTLQSIVNMKLLKRTAEEAGKKIVLITSEANILPLAGAVKIHVAKSLQSKPAIPPPPEVGPSKEIVTEDSGQDASVDKSKSVGELAGMTAVAATAKDDVDDDTINVDSIDDEPAPKSKAKNNKLKIPNFDKFRLRLFIAAGVLILLIIGLIFANKILPKASVTIKTNSVDINATLTLTANTDQKTVDVPNSVIPAVQQDTTGSSDQHVTASGKKNVGDKATGSVIMRALVKGCASPASSIAAGATITNGVVSYITNDDANFSFSGTVDPSSGSCIWNSNSVDVTAADGGAKYNLAAGSQFNVSGHNATASNSADMAGGTDKTVTIVSQADIDTAKQKASQDTDKAKADLSSKFKDLNLYALTPTLQAGKQTVTSSAQVGEEATDVTVTVKTAYSMLGVKQDDLKKLIDNFAKGQIDTSKQKISDYGLDSATITINSTKSATNQTMSLQVNATAGASIDIASLKNQIKGKKSGQVKQMISDLPSVQDVTVSYSPFWVTKAPGNTSKITIVVQNQQASGNGNSR